MSRELLDLSAVREGIRGLATLGRFFLPGPLVAYRSASARGGRTAARAPLRAHFAELRRRAGVRLDVAGAEQLPAAGGFVLVYNQTSILDDLGNLEIFWTHGIDYSVVAAEYSWIPFARGAAQRSGIVLLRRGNRSATGRALDQLTMALRGGARISMAPEGRLSPEGEVGHFKRGAFLIAIRAGVPVVPMCVQGGRELLAPRSVRMRPGTLRYRIGAPLDSSSYADEEAPAFAEQARACVAELYREAQESDARAAGRSRTAAGAS